MEHASFEAVPTSPGELKIVQDATCTFCGCVCDDIDLSVKDNHIVEAKRACVLGKAWFLNHHIDDRPSCLIWGMRDWCFRPDCLERFIQAWPGAEVHRLADVGHWVVEDAPDESNAIVEQFLARAHVCEVTPHYDVGS